jgi:hypothetical protein
MVLKKNKTLNKFFKAYRPDQIDAMMDMLNMLMPLGVDTTNLIEGARVIVNNKRRRGVTDPVERERIRDANKKEKYRREQREKREAMMKLEPLALIGFCECGGLMGGEVVKGCHNNRIFYKECDTCDYYAELVEHAWGLEDLVRGGFEEEIEEVEEEEEQPLEIIEVLPAQPRSLWKEWINKLKGV